MQRYKYLAILLAILIGGWGITQIPAVQARLAWRIETGLAYMRGVLDPVQPLPTALPLDPALAIVNSATPQPSATPTPAPAEASPTAVASTLIPTFTPIPLPAQAMLAAPAYVVQTMNNCGPANLAMYLSLYGWDGTQADIARKVKPFDVDRNVNPEELKYYVDNFAGWLRAEFRVDGTLDLLKRLLAAGFPVMVETSIQLDQSYWPEDDRWAAHYLTLFAYDDAAGGFTAHDSFYGPDKFFSYADLEASWRIFNHVYFLVYRPEREGEIKTILGTGWEMAAGRKSALARAETETKANPQDAYAWFNLGNNLVYFERYLEASLAYDKAREIGLPQRMLRYQFGPFFAYFHSGRTEDLLVLVDYALRRTPNSEEALLWKGWGLYRNGDTLGAAANFREALEHNPTYADARYALDFLGASP
jgi:tetratricopeptide (TPR) repeat protein